MKNRVAVRILAKTSSVLGTFKAGDVLRLTENDARALIDTGAAERVKGDEAEGAISPAPETGRSARARVKGQ